MGERSGTRALDGRQVGFFCVGLFFDFAEFFFVTLNGTVLSRDLWIFVRPF